MTYTTKKEISKKTKTRIYETVCISTETHTDTEANYVSYKKTKTKNNDL